MKPIFILLLFAVALLSCKQKKNAADYFNEENLSSQIFSINTDIDNTLMTMGGCVIKIPKGSLKTGIRDVKLEVKEALTNTEIVLAGLNTMSGGQALSSGGMIYINAAQGYEVKIIKPLEVLVLTQTYNRDMHVYKGIKDEKGKIDWNEPVNLPIDETIQKIERGGALFKANCANCHKGKDDSTGPALYGITYRKSKEWLANFTRKPFGNLREEFISDTSHHFQYDYYSICLLNKWQPTVMTAFPNLSDIDLENIYGYIKSETDKEPAINNNYGYTCCDSCELYKNELNELMDLDISRHESLGENGYFYNLDRQLPLADTNVVRPVVSNTNEFEKKYVQPVNSSATFYTINISTFGWYNIDILMKDFPTCKPSELFVRIQGSYKADFHVNLIIPSHKAFVEGGKLKDGEQYGFDETNGKIPLPPGATCYIIGFAEYEGKILFGKTSFIAGSKQTISLQVMETNKEEITRQINALNLDEVKVEVKDSKKANEIKAVDKSIDSLRKLLPKNCNCMPLLAATAPISGQIYMQDNVYSSYGDSDTAWVDSL